MKVMMPSSPRQGGMMPIVCTLLVQLLCLHSVRSNDDANRRLEKRLPPKTIKEYHIMDSEAIERSLVSWSDHYTDLTRLTNAQDEYGLPRAGGAHDCPFFTEGDGCPNSILTIQDYIAHPEGSNSSLALPEVLWSGELHGDEQVGPTAVMQATLLLLEAAQCLQYPRHALRQSDPTAWDADVAKAKKCRKDLEDTGIYERDIWWLGRLVTTRRIIVIPTTNALGYFRKRREEGSVDPNRDFPYDYQANRAHPEYNTECMKTVAARTLNEVFREHMFQLSLTFHGGMEVIGYEWGAPTYGKSPSPDDVAQGQIGAAYSRFGGGWPESKPYAYGPMNQLVYPVRGGMEDWAYAGSWDKDRVIPCKPSTFPEYPYAMEKTQYDDSTLRTFNMLVETSNFKIPNKNLGTSEDLLDGSSVAGNGHISRNARLALLSAELVQPWLAIRRVNEVDLTDDLIPLADRSGRSCQETSLVTVPTNSRKVTIEWSVGGGLHIDETRLWYAKWSDIPAESLNCLDQPALNIQELMKEGTAISDNKGKTKYASQQSASTAHFSASMDISDFKAHDKLVVMASARLDQSWKNQPQGTKPEGLVPQSHIVNARTNLDWFHSKENGKVIRGRLDWFSAPLTIEIGELLDEVQTFELSARLAIPDAQHGARPANATPLAEVPAHKSGMSPFHAIIALLASVVMITCCCACVGICCDHERIRRRRRKRVRQFIHDESAPNPGLQQPRAQGPDDEGVGPVGLYTDSPEPGVEMGERKKSSNERVEVNVV